MWSGMSDVCGPGDLCSQFATSSPLFASRDGWRNGEIGFVVMAKRRAQKRAK